MPYISDSSSLIALNQIGHLDLLATLPSNVAVPPAMVRETARSVTPPPWIQEHRLIHPIDPQITAAGLGPGESEVIALGLALPGSSVVFDDQPARVPVSTLGLPVVGTLGIVLDCKRRGVIAHVKPLVDQLMAFDFYISPVVYAHVLALAGET